MAYQLGDDPEMDEIVWGIRKFVPGFFPGCEMEIMSVSGSFIRRTDVIGRDFVTRTSKGALEAVLTDLKAGRQTVFDAKNRYGVNLSSTDVMVISDQKDSFVKLDQTIKRLRDFIPGYEFGCMLKVVKVPDVDGTCRVGDKFKSTTWIDRLYQFVGAMIDNRASAAIDHKNTYGANYERDSLAAVGHTESYEEPLKEISYDKFSQGYRIKTIPEMEKEYGSLSDVPGYFNPMAMVHLAGVPVTNQFADSVIEHGRFKSDDNDFKNPSLTKDNSWGITKEMLTNKPLHDLVFGKFKPGDIVVSLTTLGKYTRKEGDIFKVSTESTTTALSYSSTSSSDANAWRLATEDEEKAYHSGVKNIFDIVDDAPSGLATSVKKKEIEFVSDFTTAQLKPKSKRQKLSIN